MHKGRFPGLERETRTEGAHVKRAFVFQAHPIVGYCFPPRPAATPQSRPSSGYSRMCAVSKGLAQEGEGGEGVVVP